MRRGILPVIGLTLFAAAAVFWADCYTYMKSAQNAGEKFRLADYAESISDRIAGRPDALAMRRARKAEIEQAEKAANSISISVAKLNGMDETDEPQFLSARDRHGDDTTGAMNSRFGSSGGSIRFISAK
ncbi:MAG: hypothetical protein ACU0DK_12645 [Pseudooceanicola sp.]